MDELIEAEPYALEVVDSPPDIEQLLSDLISGDVTRRMLAARAFSEIQDERSVPALIDLLADDCPLVRVSAAYALGRNPCPAAVEPLIATLLQDWNGYVRKGLVWALGNCQDARAFDSLVDALVTDIPAVQLWAASALGQLGDPRAVAPLATALKADPVAVVRSNCAWALGKLGDKEAGVPALLSALDDDDLSVQQDVREALNTLGYHYETDAADPFEIA
ncbi:HEAT repeat domain-containing protein [Gloeobacter kilaueensis]|uniref:Lyase n=1 Tax=Gloeobacter kilaueensis (strain ATCC BAA-2537 / CCAP 1431/1 / ULC 316 / JS1) TaxID=1183438 RepID=U5QG31_GLOK1|nr:HEAT repeat domain-containing protein [Gloeobacter kilaueensis]AGY57876.1 lyase [Gloeobacter kilaueensis JS1]